MDKARTTYAAYMLFFLVFVGSMAAVPFMAFGQDMGYAYDAFAPTCHQKLSRSLCIFSANESYFVADCTAQGAGYVSDLADRRGVRVIGADGLVGYKMPVCARDFGIYSAMLLAGAVYPFVRRIESRAMYPAMYLIIAMVPIAVDGGLQLLTEIDRPLFGSNIFPFEYESTNLMRLATGVIAGFAASFYAIPVLVNVFGGQDYYENMRGGREAKPGGRRDPQAPSGTQTTQAPHGKGAVDDQTQEGLEKSSAKKKPARKGSLAE